MLAPDTQECPARRRELSTFSIYLPHKQRTRALSGIKDTIYVEENIIYSNESAY